MFIAQHETADHTGQASVHELLSAPGLGSLTLLAGDPARIVRSVRVVAEERELRTLTADELVVVLPTVFADAVGHQFDVALRDTAATGAAAVVLTGVAADAVEPTARRIADRHALALLTAPLDAEPTPLVIAVARVLDGDTSTALARVDTARHRIAEASGTDAILAAAAEALATEVAFREPDHAEPAALVEVDGIADGYVTAAVPVPSSGAWVVAARAVVRLAADAYARAVAEGRRTDLAPIHDRGRLLGELLLAPESERAPLVARARSLGVAVDGWHQVLRFELTSSLTREPVTTTQLDAAGNAALDAVRAREPAGADGHGGDGGWHSTRIGGDVLLVRTTAASPGHAAAHSAHQAASAALVAARERLPGLMIRCGIGGSHRRAEGLRTSATDARAALAATRQSVPAREIVAIDALGLNPMLVEWYASDATRASVDDLLAPLTGLGSQSAEDAIRTLQSYLDHQSSPAKAAKDLNVHPQTVTYRLRKINTLLHVDFNDPEQRLALQLACRAWLMR